MTVKFGCGCSTCNGTYKPWYVRGRRLALYPFMQLFRFLFVLTIYMGWGKGLAAELWEDTQ